MITIFDVMFFGVVIMIVLISSNAIPYWYKSYRKNLKDNVERLSISFPQNKMVEDFVKNDIAGEWKQCGNVIMSTKKSRQFYTQFNNKIAICRTLHLDSMSYVRNQYFTVDNDANYVIKILNGR